MALYQGFNDLEKLGLVQALADMTHSSPSSPTLTCSPVHTPGVGDNERKQNLAGLPKRYTTNHFGSTVLPVGLLLPSGSFPLRLVQVATPNHMLMA